MREGVDAPTESIPDEDLARVRSFLDAQSRVDVAVWVRHRHTGPEGVMYDHHLMLGLADDDCASGDMGALEVGIGIPRPGWLDVFPLSEVEALRSFGTVVWERDDGPRTGDPLDFRFTWEPLQLEPEAVDAFATLVAAVEGVARIEGAIERLWKNGSEIRHSAHLYIDFRDRRPHDFERIENAAREAGLSIHGTSAGLPNRSDVRTSTLYEAGRR